MYDALLQRINGVVTVSEKKYVILATLLICIALSAGCTEASLASHWKMCDFEEPPLAGEILSNKSVIVVQEKWRDIHFNGQTGYYARFGNGYVYSVDPQIYSDLPTGKTIVGCMNFGGTLISFIPVNVTRYEDFKNLLVVLP